MLCKNPYQKGDALYPCGQCMPCRINRRRVWTHRIMLEALQHDGSTFATLTYGDENVPKTKDGLGTLVPEHLSGWLKRFRERISPARVRFYAVGEYGDETWRPHYHVALFGFASCEYGNSRYSERRTSCCFSCDLVRDTWGFGHILLGDLSIKSAQYIAGYTTKKLTDYKDGRLQGRYPEFARMSLRPGIGGEALWEVASQLMAFGLDELPDVPGGLRHGSSVLPLGRYLRRRLRVLTGKEPGAPEETLAPLKEKLRPVFEAAWEAPRGGRVPGVSAFKELAVQTFSAESDSLVNKARIHKKRAVL